MERELMAYRNSYVKSRQAGSIAITGSALSNTATITSVDVTNSILVWNGQTYTLGTSQSNINRCRLTFTNATTITATRGATNPSVPTVYFTVVEYYPGLLKSVQRGTINLNNATNVNSAALSAVVVAKSQVMSLGMSTVGTADTYDVLDMALFLISTTAVNASRVTLQATDDIIGFQVVEYK